MEGGGDATFYPGGQGPFGFVTNVSMYHFNGTMWFTWNPVTNQTTQFAYAGTVTDVCAALS